MWFTGLKSYTSLYTLDGNAVLDKRGARDHNAGLVAMNAVTSLGTSQRQLGVNKGDNSAKGVSFTTHYYHAASATIFGSSLPTLPTVCSLCLS